LHEPAFARYVVVRSFATAAEAFAELDRLGARLDYFEIPQDALELGDRGLGQSTHHRTFLFFVDASSNRSPIAALVGPPVSDGLAPNGPDPISWTG
jgi:hypothetical protein